MAITIDPDSARLQMFLWHVIASNGDPLSVLGGPEDDLDTIALALGAGHVTTSYGERGSDPWCWTYQITDAGRAQLDLVPGEDCDDCGAGPNEPCLPHCLAIEQVRDDLRSLADAAK